MIKFKHKSRWKPAPEGIHNAVVVDVVGDGSGVGASASACDNIRVVWEIEATQSNGCRFTVTKIYPGANAFAQDFEAVLPAEHPLVTGDTENVESIIGTPARLDQSDRRTAGAGGPLDSTAAEGLASRTHQRTESKLECQHAAGMACRPVAALCNPQA